MIWHFTAENKSTHTHTRTHLTDCMSSSVSTHDHLALTLGVLWASCRWLSSTRCFTFCEERHRGQGEPQSCQCRRSWIETQSSIKLVSVPFKAIQHNTIYGSVLLWLPLLFVVVMGFIFLYVHFLFEHTKNIFPTYCMLIFSLVVTITIAWEKVCYLSRLCPLHKRFISPAVKSYLPSAKTNLVLGSFCAARN